MSEEWMKRLKSIGKIALIVASMAATEGLVPPGKTQQMMETGIGILALFVKRPQDDKS